MSHTPNLKAFFYARWSTVEQHMENGAKDKADDICRELVADYACPLAIRISAWQTRAVCAGKDQYYEAMQYLENAVALCDRAPNDLCLPSDDPEILRFKENCLSMISALNQYWTKKWNDAGRVAPTEEEMEAAEPELQEGLANGAEASALKGEASLSDIVEPSELPEIPH